MIAQLVFMFLFVIGALVCSIFPSLASGKTARERPKQRLGTSDPEQELERLRKIALELHAKREEQLKRDRAARDIVAQARQAELNLTRLQKNIDRFEDQGEYEAAAVLYCEEAALVCKLKDLDAQMREL